MRRSTISLRTCLAALCIAALMGLAAPLSATPYFLIDTEMQWQEALSSLKLTPVKTAEWADYMNQWSAYLEEGEPYPSNAFRQPELYMWPGSGGGGLNPEDAGLVMVWGDNAVPGHYSAAFRYDFQLDPDLSNCTITVTVTAPQFDLQGNQINTVSFGIQDVAGAVRSWHWNVGPMGPIVWNTPTTITINTNLVGVAAATPVASGYMSNPMFQLTMSQFFIVDENATWVGGPTPVPPPGQLVPRAWNYWHNLMVTPTIQNKPPLTTKWSQPPVEIGPGLQPPLFYGWDERSSYQWRPIMADDWLCTDNRPVTDIHWWGSFIGWDQPYPPQLPKAFHIGIWRDVPANPPDVPFSHPGELVWENMCETYQWNFAGYDKDPRGIYQNEACFQFNQWLKPEEYFHQEPGPNGQNIYWLSIAAIYDDQPQFPWGWKTRPHFFNDDAVRIFRVYDPTGIDIWPPFVGCHWAQGDPVEWQGESWDLAFELSTEEVTQIDWGDAPNVYPVTSAANGANHVITPNLFLGALIDGENDGQPDANALGDDNSGVDDEDGVVLNSPLLPGATTKVTVTASAPGMLDAWVDFDNNGSWAEVGEQIFTSVPLVAGPNPLTFTVPATAVPGTRTFARYRFSSAGGLSFVGPARDGEVEDYEVRIGYKWLQKPDLAETGIDVSASEPYILADDFLCKATGPITDIHIWGSWLNDHLPFGQDPSQVEFTLSIHKDIPANQSPTGYSMPGQVLWFRHFPARQFAVMPYAQQIDEGWMTPPSQYLFPGDHVCWQYDFLIPEEPFIQQGTEANPVVYWLDVQAKPLDPDAHFGWKTSLDHWNDDAVWGQGVEPYLAPWNELRYPPNHTMGGQSIDLAFAVTGTAAQPGSLKIARNIPLADHFWWRTDPDPYNEMASILALADPTEAIAWTSVTVQASGTGDDAADIAAVEVWQDNDNDGKVTPADVLLGAGTYPVDEGWLAVPLAPAPIIPPGGSVAAVVSYTMNPGAPIGRNYTVQVTGGSGIGQTSGVSVPVTLSPPPIQGAKKTVAPAPITIGEAKLLPVGSVVLLEGKEITANFLPPGWPTPWHWFYMEETDRSNGIGVATSMTGPVTIGGRVSVLGTTFLLNSAELMITPMEKLFTSGAALVTPLGMSNRWTGGGWFGAQPAVVDDASVTPARVSVGLNNVGCLIKTWGRVTGYGGVSLGGGNWVDVTWIDDGSNLADGYTTTAGTASVGIAVVTPMGISVPLTGYWSVTGILRTVQNPAGQPVRLLVPRDFANDWVQHAP